MSTRETVKQRRDRERSEREEAEARWEAQRPMRLMHAMARARGHGAEAHVYHRHDSILHYFFDLPEEGSLTDPVDELGEHLMRVIEARLDHMDQQRWRAIRMSALRQDVLRRLTAEEIEALGL